MIVPMKKVSLIIRGEQKQQTLKTLRKLGIIHIEIAEGAGQRLEELREQRALLERALYTVGKNKNAEQKSADLAKVLAIAARIAALEEEKTQCLAERITLQTELERLKSWGEIDPSSISDLEAKGYEISFYEMPKAEYAALPEDLKTVRIDATKSTVRFLLLKAADETVASLNMYRLALPQTSTVEMKQRL
ncbi:MAG: hypothetical protein IKK30_02395, partial [Clostridia bacterium]|nr:hypothetical protein [Clostridia bacterium]